MQLLRKILGWPFKLVAFVFLFAGLFLLLIHSTITGKLELFGKLMDAMSKAVEELK